MTLHSLAIIKVLGHQNLVTDGTDASWLVGAQVMIKVSGHHHRWLAGGYNLEIEYF